ncbi:hypothetical protein [Pseudoalteromonas luteoviolacea]|uniref:Uncharacterized protein n=1 Tax=Pseudoalteromonas luteoviolacea (strain 2ta16) TaxID=1353533 RepID=V4HTX4_PSEL2|nr:hypothetical protein [Pseudoalteromonas luteoviolacea]ESP93243.1 hypothetical protein PL2TA16_03464 [Pseudoalteromonas luteoviolacea 2ta16]KZN36638.1 hypothetical protein N483_22220 [Pseudoalteromonas luteoviolacea NCIMB 1944]
MANLLRKTLKSFFKRGKKPTESQFAQWLDACLLQGEDGIEKSENGLEIRQNLRIKGDLTVEGTFWLAKHWQSSPSDVETQSPESLPEGAIFLWYGSKLPPGYGLCNGKEGKPLLHAPLNSAHQLQYIIKLP